MDCDSVEQNGNESVAESQSGRRIPRRDPGYALDTASAATMPRGPDGTTDATSG